MNRNDYKSLREALIIDAVKHYRADPRPFTLDEIASLAINAADSVIDRVVEVDMGRTTPSYATFVDEVSQQVNLSRSIRKARGE